MKHHNDPCFLCPLSLISPPPMCWLARFWNLPLLFDPYNFSQRSTFKIHLGHFTCFFMPFMLQLFPLYYSFFFYGAARKFFQEHSSIPVMPLLLMHWCLPTAPKIGSQVSFKSHVVILSWPMRTSPSYSGIMSSPPPHHHFALLVLAILCFVTHRLYSCLESYILCLLFQCLFPQIFILRSPEKMPEWPDRSI